MNKRTECYIHDFNVTQAVGDRYPLIQLTMDLGENDEDFNCYMDVLYGPVRAINTFLRGQTEDVDYLPEDRTDPQLLILSQEHLKHGDLSNVAEAIACLRAAVDDKRIRNRINNLLPGTEERYSIKRGNIYFHVRDINIFRFILAQCPDDVANFERLIADLAENETGLIGQSRILREGIPLFTPINPERR